MRALLVDMNKACKTNVTKMVVELDNEVESVEAAVNGEKLTLKIPTSARPTPPVLPVSHFLA